MLKAAGLMLLTARDGRALFLRRSDTGLWAFPGGRIEDGETAEQAAERETLEEVGPAPHSNPAMWMRRIKDEVDFTTFVAKVEKEFVPVLNDEHTAWTWGSVTDPPQPMHPGAAVAIARLTMDELGVARAMAAGDLVSPQQYGGFWLWKIRITGTGVAWRGAEKNAAGKIIREEEFCWRDKAIYHTQDFLARCNGLPVTFIHSEGKTDSKEWSERAVGTVFLPFIEDDDVQSIAKVYDEDANTILAGGFSTSPAVFFGAHGAGHKMELNDGTKVLFEGKPALLDSIALVPAGVWDKGGKPSGVDSTGVSRQDAAFNESDHPRETDGKFAEGAGSGRASLKETKTEGGKRVQASGQSLPAHVEKLKLPPAWTDVRYSDDPKADLLAVGKDSKGRVQSVYSDAFSATQAAAKFDRIEELRGKFGYVSDQNANAQKSDNAKTKDAADCLDLIMKMGVRPGSETDTGAAVKAYGATTLEGRHVVKTDAGVSLRFVGKKGVSLDLPVHDKSLAEMLTKRAADAGDDGKLFPSTNDKDLLAHVHTLNGGGFKTKDFRTHVGTSTAYALVQKQAPPKSLAEYKRAVMAVAKEVSQRLGNTPVIALQSYISPAVFAEWRAAL